VRTSDQDFDGNPVALASGARPIKLPTISPNARDAHHVKSQWSQNLFTTRDEDNVVEQTSLALRPEETILQ
jgi:hypothetical protein